MDFCSIVRLILLESYQLRLPGQFSLSLLPPLPAFLAGRYLSQQRHYTFCLVMAAVACMFMPFGTVLGVFTIIVLVRESVKELFAQGKPSASELEA